MSKRDFYETLGVSRTADAKELKAAYRKLAMKYHPDQNPDNAEAEQKFKELNEAYGILKDDQQRAAYDNYGHAAFENGGGGGAGGFDFGGGGGFADIFEEMFGGFGGGGRRSGGSQRGGDLRYNMEISLEDAFNGKQAEIRIPSSVSCDSCNGSGAEKGSSPITCGTCKGNGRVRMQQGFFTVERTCHSCQGVGKVIEKPCKSCHGSGHIEKEKTLQVTIPAGVEEGNRIRLSGEGEHGRLGGTPGDLYIFLSIAPHRIFQRDGTDIHCRVPISMTQAALGGSVEVPTVDGGRAKVAIPEGTQNRQQFRLRGKGMSVLRSASRGDMYVEVSVETPVNLTSRQRELLQEFEKEATDNSPQSSGFFKRVKEFWEDLTD
ncbi:molecular chaperone DnaJ [Kiloniella laminariae]|uniref:Chaperone protein DnaJ n=1 Tax=Kiloniella laminariae TaxID=454162 RepID=A0ABT4LJI8_9PROT|nr:molecular chaperone DnaJ [Kiloniella laminariae]MCZ4281249.1 molecular chaperone DnaJ [Kiloniella laminariae]